MNQIILEVPDSLAVRFQMATERKKLEWAHRLAGFVGESASTKALDEVKEEIKAWQARKGIQQGEFEQLFTELAKED